MVGASAGLLFVLFCTQASHRGERSLFYYFLIVRSMEFFFLNRGYRLTSFLADNKREG